MTKYANDIVLLADDNWNLVEVNETALSAYGYSREEMLNMSVFDLRTEYERNIF